MKYLIIALLLISLAVKAQKPKVWIISDGSDKNIVNHANGKRIGDPDDLSAIAGYLLMSNMFDTRAIVVGSAFNISMDYVHSQKAWADSLFLSAYKKDLPKLNANIGGYQSNILFMESFLRKHPNKYNPDKNYNNLNKYSTVKALFEEAEHSNSLINVMCWGTLTEPAILVNYCLHKGRQDVLNKLRFISHWTNSSYRVGTVAKPDSVHNCFNDETACAYIKHMALNGHIKFYECSAIGQYGIVSGGNFGRDYYKQFTVSKLGKVFYESKYASWEKSVDDSDCATYWVLLGNWGVSLNDISDNGTNYPEIEKRNEKAFFNNAPRIRHELLRRAQAAQ